MNKTAIKNYAIWARVQLIEAAKQKAYEYAVTDGENVRELNAIGGRLLTETEKKQRRELLDEIRKKGYQQVMEEAAYTWFNRFIALRFMEVNGYLPSMVRVFTDETGAFKPEVLKEAMTVELAGLDRAKVLDLIDKQNNDALYQYLLITQCNALNDCLPQMFERIDNWTELLFPKNLLRSDSVLGRLISEIPEEDWHDAVEIIGWLYQYYISEKHDEVIDPLHGKDIKKEDIPAATQLFTTDWVVRYIIDNSLGRYWIERHPESKLAEKLEYFVTPKDGIIPIVNENIRPEELKVLDPCVGSGHFLSYAYDILIEIYRECGWSDRDTAVSILKNNLYGLDIDDRAAQLAFFAVMMKARKYNRKILSTGVKPHVHALQESALLTEDLMRYIAGTNIPVKMALTELKVQFRNAKELGSIILMPKFDLQPLVSRINEIISSEPDNIVDLQYREATRAIVYPLVQQTVILSNHYHAVITNPPYLNKYSPLLKNYILDHFTDFKGDLFSVFMFRNFGFCMPGGYSGLMTPNVWLSIKTFEPLRHYILQNYNIISLVQMAHGAFNEVACVDVCAFVLATVRTSIDGVYIKLSDHKGDMDFQKNKVLEAINSNTDYKFYAKAENLMLVPDSPITAYSASEKMLKVYNRARLLGSVADPKQGLATADNNRFLRQWYEVDFHRICFDCRSLEETTKNGFKWYPYNKGGDFRKWYGNNDFIVNWENNGSEIRSFTDEHGRLRSRPQNTQYYFKECISWSLISSYTIAFRYKPIGHIFDIAGMSCFGNSEIPLMYLLALNNSCLIGKIMLMLAPTINYQSGNIANIPVIYDKKSSDEVCSLAQRNVSIAKEDWDEFETSWDFIMNPLVCMRDHSTLKASYQEYAKKVNSRFAELAENEVLLNQLFIKIYGVEGEISPAIIRRDISSTFIYEQKDDIPADIKESYYVRTKEDIIHYLISYAVGCMFGRYSLDVPGLAYAGGAWDASKYKTFIPDEDNVLPICDDEYFEDDIVGRFVTFIEAAYGKESLEENLKFIADALGGKGTSRQVIRNYFLNDFYADHLKIYQKRPIYWLFDSGKKNGFKCLIYMHRYQPDTIARIRTDYVHEQQERYRSQIQMIEDAMQSASTAERVKLNKQLTKFKDQALELQKYEEKIHHLADQAIPIDLDDGVKVNYAKFEDVLAKVK